MEEELVSIDGKPLTEEEISLLVLLIEAGYDIADPELEGYTVEELLPQVRMEFEYVN